MSVGMLVRYRHGWMALRSLADGIVSSPLVYSFFTVYVVFFNTLCLYELLVLLVIADWQTALLLFSCGLNLMSLFVILCCAADSASKAVSKSKRS